MDPDYAVTEGAKKDARERESREASNFIERARIALEKGFNSEIKLREAQLEEIQNKLTKVAKTLHVLRYVLIKSFYENEDLILNKGSDDLKILDAQNRIHPAVKELLGSKANVNTETTKRQRVRKIHTIQTVTKEPIENTLKENTSISSKENVANKPEAFSFNNLGVDIVPIRNRPMIKKRIVVGNISKWMPSEDAEDNSTHKWMVYVRGPKDTPDISDFVKKVVFHLHPSYKPNDVIELKEGPFHLSRRGWGEFPLRVRIFFCNTLNKPVDVIHNLKLDKTHTGQQTLGNETVVELTMHGNKVFEVPLVKPIEENSEEVEIKEEVIIKKEEITCNALLDHCYALKNDQELKSDESLNVSTLSEDNTAPEKRKVCDEIDYNTNSPKKIKLENGCLGVNKNSTINNNKYKIYFPSSNFKLTVQAMPYLLKKLPLISELASDVDFKCTYPFISKSKEEFDSLPIEKQNSCEWSRAKFIKEMISKTEIKDKDEWNTKKILLYANANGYSELNHHNKTYNADFMESKADILDSPKKKYENKNNNTMYIQRNSKSHPEKIFPTVS